MEVQHQTISKPLSHTAPPGREVPTCRCLSGKNIFYSTRAVGYCNTHISMFPSPSCPTAALPRHSLGQAHGLCPSRTALCPAHMHLKALQTTCSTITHPVTPNTNRFSKVSDKKVNICRRYS